MPDFHLILVRSLLAAFVLLPLSATLQAQSAPPSGAASGIYPLPQPNEHLVGHPRTTVASQDDTLVMIGRRYRTGYGAIRTANPMVDSWMPGQGTEVLLPTWHILPEAAREGIIVNTAEMRLYHFEQARGEQPTRVGVYAISIGRDGRETPHATARVTRKAENPTWYPTESIRSDRAARGKPVPAMVPPGPDNPLGTRALYLTLPAYLIHGTNRDMGIGMPVTSGCVRMYPEDIEYLYDRVPVGSKVEIVHQPVKAGWSGDVLYVESHQPPEGVGVPTEQRLLELRAVIARTVGNRAGFTVDWNKVRDAVLESTGVPVPVGPAWLVDETLDQVATSEAPAG